jgi:hypothetical protein
MWRNGIGYTVDGPGGEQGGTEVNMPKGRPKKDAASAGGAQPGKASKANGNGANLGFEAQLFLAADKLRKNLEPSDYKHVALGLIFLKHISNAFEAKRATLLAEDPAAAEAGEPATTAIYNRYSQQRSALCIAGLGHAADSAPGRGDGHGGTTA